MIPSMLNVVTLMAATIAVFPGLTIAQAVGNIECFNGQPNEINAGDMQELINDLRAENIAGLENPVDLRSTFTIGQKSSQSISRGPAAQSIIRNNQPFSSTHVKQEDWAKALQQVKDQCCGSFPTCIGGSTGVKGDTGLVVEVIMTHR